MRRAALLGSLAASMLCVGAQAAVLEEFSVEDWSGFALADDQSGRLTSCAVYSKYQNGATLFFVKHAEGGWVLSLVHESWALSENGSYPVQYRVDREPYAGGSGIALDVDQIGVALPDDDPVIAAVRRGSLLNVQFQGREFGFDLTNSGKALAAAAECTERNRDKVAPKVADEAGGIPPVQTPGSMAPEPLPAVDQPGPATDGHAAVPERETFGPWVVTATRDSSDRFLNCTAFGVHGTDQLILSYYPDGAWDLSLYRGDWALEADRSYSLAYNVDGAIGAPRTVTRPVEAVEGTRILVELDSRDGLIARVENGSELNLQLSGGPAGAEDFRYPLTGAPEALAATRACTARHADGPQARLQ